jgi:hypothetical protein
MKAYALFAHLACVVEKNEGDYFSLLTMILNKIKGQDFDGASFGELSQEEIIFFHALVEDFPSTPEARNILKRVMFTPDVQSVLKNLEIVYRNRISSENSINSHISS